MVLQDHFIRVQVSTRCFTSLSADCHKNQKQLKYQGIADKKLDQV